MLRHNRTCYGAHGHSRTGRLREPSKIEQIRYLQALWDQIADDTALPALESHLALVEERLLEHKRHPEQIRPAFEELDRLAQQLP
jgi:hypothetical protein